MKTTYILIIVGVIMTAILYSPIGGNFSDTSKSYDKMITPSVNFSKFSTNREKYNAYASEDYDPFKQDDYVVNYINNDTVTISNNNPITPREDFYSNTNKSLDEYSIGSYISPNISKSTTSKPSGNLISIDNSISIKNKMLTKENNNGNGIGDNNGDNGNGNGHGHGTDGNEGNGKGNNPTPIGDGLITLISLLTVYILLKIFVLKKV